jgi:hypothetical protein
MIDIPRDTGCEAEGIARTEADHFMQCPVCQQWFDMRDLGQVADHIHGSEIEFSDETAPAPRRTGALAPVGRCPV